MPIFALPAHLRQLFRQRMARAHPPLYERLAPEVWQQAWVNGPDRPGHSPNATDIGGLTPKAVTRN